MKVEHLEVTGTITVKHPDAPFGISITSDPTGGGIWIGGTTFIAIHNIQGQVCLAVGKTDETKGHAFAIMIDEKGEPGLQVCRPGKEALQLNGAEIEDLFRNYRSSASASEDVKKLHLKTGGT